MRWLLIVVLVFALSGCSSNDSGSSGSTRQSSSGAATPVADMSALEQMELAFEGNPKVSTIKPKVDQALRLYGHALTEDNYSRAGSTLVALRQQNGVSEMDILDYMICSYVPGSNVTFPDMAALSSVALLTGDRCR